MRYILLVLTLALWVQTTLADDIYKTYHNARYCYSIAYPKNILYPQGVGLCRSDMSLIQAIPLSNSLMPNATAERFQPNTSSATRGLPSNIVNTTSPIAWRRTGHGIKETRRTTSSATSGDMLLRFSVDVFMCRFSG